MKYLNRFVGLRNKREKRQADGAHMTETRKETNQVWMCEEVRSTNKMKKSLSHGENAGRDRESPPITFNK